MAYLSSNRDAQEVNESDILVPNDLDLVNKTKTAQIIPELLLCHVFVEATKIDVATGIALTDGKRNLGGDRRRLTPTNLQLLSVEAEFLDCGVGMEGSCSARIQERQEDARLFGKDSNRLKGTEVHQVQKLVDGSGGRKVSNVNGARSSCRSGGKSGAKSCRGIRTLSIRDIEAERRKSLLF